MHHEHGLTALPGRFTAHNKMLGGGAVPLEFSLKRMSTKQPGLTLQHCRIPCVGQANGLLIALEVDRC